MARTNHNGKALNPHYTAKRYAAQLKNKSKKDKDGKAVKLTKAQASYRMGYLSACSDSAATFKSSNPNYGYDAQNGKFGDLKILGIVDPAKVLRCALQNAVSVATTILTTNCIAI